MTTFYIFRHGETFVTRDKKRWYGRKVFSAQILEEGKPIIKKMGIYLKNVPSDQNFCSPYKRCRQTAEIITYATQKEFVYDKRLGEFLWEPLGYFKRRLKSFLKMVEKNNYQNVFVCTHGAVIPALIKLIQGKDFNETDLAKPNPGVLFIVEGKAVKAINFNL
jgi:broad specificity phosphatase PhoE